jgi:hypothetical protein
VMRFKQVTQLVSDDIVRESDRKLHYTPVETNDPPLAA